MSGNQSRAKTCIRRTELIVNGILFGIWNNLTTIINAKTLVDEGHSWGAALTLFFLFFPGKNKTWFYYHSSICPVIHPSNKSVFYFSTSIWVLGTPNAGWNLLLLVFQIFLKDFDAKNGVRFFDTWAWGLSALQRRECDVIYERPISQCSKFATLKED